MTAQILQVTVRVGKISFFNASTNIVFFENLFSIYTLINPWTGFGRVFKKVDGTTVKNVSRLRATWYN